MDWDDKRLEKGSMSKNLNDSWRFLSLHVYSLIYRNVANIRGLTRETLITLTTNIESREQKRVSNNKNGYSLEHPRSATTDDVECDCVGKHFTHFSLLTESVVMNCAEIEPSCAILL